MMFYLGIDQHARQITISLRDENGDVLLARQVSTQPDKINALFQKLTRERLGNGDTFVAVLEVCGFNDWLIRMLNDYHCQKRTYTSFPCEAGSPCTSIRSGWSCGCAARIPSSRRGRDRTRSNLRNADG